MYELYPYFTNDGSVGLFSPSDDDVYHSTYGALTEAYEKFILPSELDIFFENNNEIKILDICFGIGYNTKSFLNYFFEKSEINNKHIYATGTNNISSNRKTKNSTKCRIYIKAIDTDKNLAYLSPFFVTNKKKNKKKYKLPFKHEKIEKLLNKDTKTNFKLKKETNIILLEGLLQNEIVKVNEKNAKIINKENSLEQNKEHHHEVYMNISYYKSKEINELLFSEKYHKYFDGFMLNLMKFRKKQIYKNTSLRSLSTFLHNIYYKYLSNSYKKACKCLKNNDFIFDLNIEDARTVLLQDSTSYNYIYLDAFTPAKCPCLWTLDFFKLLHSHLDTDGMILTYSNSAAVRNAFIQAGFYIGKIYNMSSNKFMGTIAVKNKALIKHELSEYDLGLLKTKAGIVYRDENLNGLNEAIIYAHKNEVEKSRLISSSKYIKTSRSKNNV